MLLRQFASVGGFLVALVLFCKDLFELLGLVFCNQPVHRSGIVAYEEIFAATVAPEGSHLLETGDFLTAALLYSHRSHLSLLRSAGCSVVGNPPGQAKRKLSSDARASPPLLSGTISNSITVTSRRYTP